MTKNEIKEVKDIQEKLLGILLYFQEFCEEHGLKFTLAGGTCLGAVRHEGFIPWDDDLDVFMLRDDYEKLPQLWEKFAETDRFSCVRSDEKINIHHSATEIKDNNTTFINKHSVDSDIHHGLMIDVIPLDGVAENIFSKFHQMTQSMLFCCFNFQRLPNHKSKFTYYATKLVLTIVSSNELRYRIWKAAENQMSKYKIANHKKVASFVEGLTIMKQHFPKEWFIKPGTAMFEGHAMPVPADVDTYLRMSYGNYMELPPESERVFRHDIAFMDLNNCYKKYRGVKYCVKKK